MTRREVLLRLTRVDPYKVLRIGPLSSQEDIKKAYRELAREFHPDRATGNAEKFKKINEAYSMVDTAEKRLRHDVMVRLLTYEPYVPTPPPIPQGGVINYIVKKTDESPKWMAVFTWFLFLCWGSGLFQLGSGIHSLIQGEWLVGSVITGTSLFWIPYLTYTFKDLPQIKKYIIPHLPEKVRKRLC